MRAPHVTGNPAIPKLIADDFAARPGNGRVAEVFAPDGRSLGLFLMEPLPPDALDPGISEEEFRRRETDKSGRSYTAAEVEAKLRELQCSS